ncbi:MAG: VCBS repeat-containing protein [Planctomycetota bacterium]|nr:VCBS repeat-containing protein [Planctomycetota bacterium]
MKTYQTSVALTCVLVAGPVYAGPWVQYADETGTRLVAASSLGANDTEEKDYAWGDVDQDGDIDLVVVRKVIGSNSGSKRNVLFMNENGVLVDRTNDYAVAADDGGQGFLDLTPDRDVALVDVDGDGWLDIVTVPAGAYTPNLPKTISHPRIYMNLGNDGDGNWQGFLYEEARFPQLVSAPNFCGVGFGDLTGDNAPDLFFNDYLNGLENRLLINDGTGFFSDETPSRFAGNTAFLTATFSVHSVIADVNHDGYNDIVNNLALGPYQMDIAYNNPANEGVFTSSNTETVFASNDYFVAVDDLNNDGLLDIVMADDFADRYFLNLGNGGDGKANWVSFTLLNSTSGFDNNTVIADLDNDGWKDILIADVDVDLPSCTSRLDIHHNLGNAPNVTFQEDVGNLPTNSGGPLRGTHDVAVFDIDGDCRLDLVIGTCNGTTVWINQAPDSACEPPVASADITGPRAVPDGCVDAFDLGAMLGAWCSGVNDPNPPSPPCENCSPANLAIADISGAANVPDGCVDAFDLAKLLAAWCSAAGGNPCGTCF